MVKQTEASRALYRRAKDVMPYGVTSNFRYWGEETPVVARAEGGCVYDPDGNRYIDYRLGFGPIILGHAYAPVVDAVSEAIREGTVFACTTEWEVRAAEKIVDLCPGVDLVRFANSGTEATMHALRIARAHTGRDRIVKFEGQYHGMYDYMLFSTASSTPSALGHRRSPIPQPMSSGIPRSIHDLVITLPFNDFEILEETLRAKWGDIAAIIVEPILGNCAGIEPQPGWLEHIRALCDEFGIVMIMDEVKTGFRIAPGGAQEVYGVMPDLTCYAKSMGNGFPVAAIGGRREVMDTLVPGQVSHGGTYTGNVVGTSAVVKTLELLADGKILATIAERGERLKAGISEILTAADIPHVMPGPGSMFGILLTTQEDPREFRDWAKADNDLYEAIMIALLERGPMPDPDAREPWFLCYAHDDSIIDETLNAFEDAVRSVKQAT